ncbi:MAG: dienelactone hydrolase family protein [Bacteroidales bacterium]|nr:dienelactone hydrolase family protein [Bacteroidales bacterium]
MKTTLKYLLVALALLAFHSCGKGSITPETEIPKDDKSEPQPQQITFSKESGTFAGVTLPYRKALVNSNVTGQNILVLYLHGGSCKGSDNEKQLTEAGVNSITNYLKNAGTKAVVIVPQCPSTAFWDAASMQPALNSLVTTTAQAHNVNTAKMYVLGGSMGGTGTWNLISSYPSLFAAAMPCAGNPSKCDVAKVSKTAVYAVMGTSDNIMSVSTVQEFISQLNAAGAKVKLDVEAGWTHEQTCTQSYTSARLLWIFSN